MGKNVLKVRMLGDFKIEYKGKELVLDRNNGSKTTQLFQILLLHTQDGGISKTALINALYGRTEVENKNGSLNNTIFRLRKQLKAIGLPESNYININAGMCTWDPNIQVEVDVCEFEKLVDLLHKEKRETDRIHLLMKTWQSYRGEFLPDMIGENWVAVENVKCRDDYFACTEELCKWLKANERYEDLHRISHKAAQIYPFDEWQVWEIESMIGMSRYKEGLEIYRNTEKLLLEELGVAPSAKMLKQFQLMGERTSQAAGAIGDIKERLREKDEAVGAYYCPYPSFIDVYHVFSRMMERSGLSVFIMLCTLDFEKENISNTEEREMSEILRTAIQGTIRKGDFYTRYNMQQYIIMLIGISQENCPIVTKRINKAFHKMTNGKKSPQVDFYVASVGEVSELKEIENDYRIS